MFLKQRQGTLDLGIIGVPLGKVAMTAVQVGGASTMAREQGFEDYIRKNFPDIHIIDKRYGEAEFDLQSGRLSCRASASPRAARRCKRVIQTRNAVLSSVALLALAASRRSRLVAACA